MKVGVDLDGVCYDFVGSVRRWLRMQGHEGALPDATQWNFFEDWGMSLTEFLAACDEGCDAGVVFGSGEPFPGTLQALRELRDSGHTIHLITDRTFGSPGMSERRTREWLNEYEVPFDTLTFSANKTVEGVAAMIEDKPSNYLALRAAGVEAYLLDRPYNQDAAAERVASLREFAERLAGR